MTTGHSSLNSIRACDIMQRKVFKLEPTTTIEDAVTAFIEMHISGAPVVDRNGRLIGMLSAFDIARPENVREGVVQSRRAEYALGGTPTDESGPRDENVVYSMDDYSPEVLRNGSVQDFMTTDVISIAPSTSLRNVCRLMVREHIHRVPVVDDAKLVGIISTLDIVRCVARTDAVR